MSFIKGLQDLKIPLEELKLATKNFGDENVIGKGGFGKVYIGKLSVSGQEITVAVKRLDHMSGQGDHEFLMEIRMLSCYRHKNLITLVGFCDKIGEKILVYEHAKHGSLDKYLSNTVLSWMQRLRISLGAARGFNYLHNDVGPQHRILHRDIKSSNILLNEDWEAKISDFGLSKIGPSNIENTFLITDVCGTRGYVDPIYASTGILTKESDVYSFGIVLFEILCGRMAYIQQYHDERRNLATWVKRHYEKNKLDEIIPPNLRKQMNLHSLNSFSMIAYQCLNGNQKERPTMGEIMEELVNAYEYQASKKAPRVKAFEKIKTLGPWGKKGTAGPQNRWSFRLERDHHLKKITIDHGDLIYSLIFTTQCRGLPHTTAKIGGWNGGETVSEVIFDWNEEINTISGTVALSRGTDAGCTIISSLSFVTNKKTHGPFGHARGKRFTVPWDEGLFAGFYGLAGFYIDSIGVYLWATT